MGNKSDLHWISFMLYSLHKHTYNWTTTGGIDKWFLRILAGEIDTESMESIYGAHRII